MASDLPKVSKAGFHLKNQGPKIILFHGLTGTPYDLRPLANFLHKKHFDVQVPLLLGHGTRVENLRQVKAESWLRQAQKVVEASILADENQPIFLGGLSMGALLAINTAQNFKQIKALVCLAPCLRLDFSAELTISLANLGLVSNQALIPKLSGGSDILDLKAKKKCPSYPYMSVFGMQQMDILRMQALKNISQIKCPVFLAFGALDQAIDAEGSKALFIKNSACEIVAKTYNQSKHVLTLDFDRDYLFADISDFLLEQIKKAQDSNL